jgi:hypothetical protein
MPKNVQIDGSKITGWDSFHDEFVQAFGFPKFYGRNMNAWIDCMSSLDAPEDGLSSVHVSRGDVIALCITAAADLRVRCPDIYEALIECSAFVNWRRIEKGEQAVLTLSFNI